MFPRRFPCALCLEDPESSMLIFPSECSVDCLKNIFFAETLAFLIFLFLSCNFFCFFFQRWDTGALKTTTQLTFDPMGQGTSESKNPLDQMFEHAFMFNRDLSKWKIPTSILWGQNFIGMISMSMEVSTNKKKYIPVHNSRGDPR